jgi:hypothetical protein
MTTATTTTRAARRVSGQAFVVRSFPPVPLYRLYPTKRGEQAKQSLQAADLERWEPEEGFKPSTFRLRVGPKPSNWTRPVPSWLLRSGADSI